MTAASDVYSLGAVAYFLLTGGAPFAGRSAVQMMAAHLYEAPKALAGLRSDVTASLSDVVARCLAKSPAARFPAMEELEAALRASVREEEWTARDARDWWRARRGEALTA